MYCWNCGAKNVDGYRQCQDCLSPPRKQGLLSRLLGFLFQVKVTARPPTLTTDHVVTRTHEADNLDDLPPDIRAKFEDMLASGQTSMTFGTSEAVTFTYEDSSGHKQTYHSLDEMPPDVRVIYERLHREHG